jgi:hypothetical protein
MDGNGNGESERMFFSIVADLNKDRRTSHYGHAVVVSLLFLFSITDALSCPDLKALRSLNITTAFDVNKLTGLWYETAYIDIAQVIHGCVWEVVPRLYIF